MDDRNNAFLQGTAVPKPSPYATASMVAAIVTLAAIFGSAVIHAMGYPTAAQFVAFGQLAFPIAIVCGHAALWQIRNKPRLFTGRQMALLGLFVGYFNLVAVAVIVIRMV